jgi:hypothetical protein
MRRGWALLLALLLAPLLGCFTGKPESAIVRHDALMPFAAPLSDDTVVMEVALLECPVNDAYINGPLWDLVDETANPERKTELHDNGFRMGVLGPALPDRLIDLVTSERNASNIRQRSLPAGNAAPVPIGPSWKHCSFELKQEGQPTAVELDKAQCLLKIVPTASKEGQIALSFTPQVQYGEMQRVTRPVQDATQVNRWDLQVNPSIENYDGLSWELTVAPNEYIVIGTQMDRVGTLGYRTFLHTENLSPVQRLLVLRVVRGPCRELKAKNHSKSPPPLALQAGWISVRGACPED